MAKSNKNLHLTLSEREIIQRGIENGSTKTSIAATLGKDKSTIGKEIKAHRVHSHICSFDPACANKDRCKHHHVYKNCADLVVFKCKRRDRSPGACNGCPKYQHCRFDKFTYSADIANKEYMADLINSREGINMTYSELKALADIIVPLIKKGQSPYQIITSHPELNISEKKLYNYIESGVFRQFGLLDIDLRVKTRRISKKDSVKYKKREDRKFLIGRTYDDFISYTDDNDNVSIAEMDTVYNGQSGPFMQTFKFLSYSFMFIIYQEVKSSSAMVEGLDLLETILGKELFSKEVEVLKTDRGSEFIDANGFEMHYVTTNRERYRIYKSNPKDCEGCPFLSQCTKSKNQEKVITRHVWESYKEEANHIRHTDEWKKIYPQRKETIERVFADAKENHGMRFTRLRGLERNQHESLIIFSCHNLKKLA